MVAIGAAEFALRYPESVIQVVLDGVGHMPNVEAPGAINNLIDDLGWKDIACCGSEFYETPNLDRPASEGMRFTDAYASCPVCSPTRTSVMTGKYPADRRHHQLHRWTR